MENLDTIAAYLEEIIATHAPRTAEAWMHYEQAMRYGDADESAMFKAIAEEEESIIKEAISIKAAMQNRVPNKFYKQ
ncbi:MAG: hypothetical protein H6673_15725 [Anaerolineales bacterium]|nr:hypothetical protein [Anaerolineales bacterium]